MSPAALASFAHRGFRYFWFGGLVAHSARWFQYVALPAVVWELTRSPGWVGLAGFAQYLPLALIAPVAGVLADHYPRRSVLMVSQSLMGSVAVLLSLAWLWGVRSPTAYVALAAMSGLAGGLNLPAWQAFVTELVPRGLLLNAVTLNSAQFNGSRVLGPMLGGVTVASAGPQAAFLVSAGGCLAVMFALTRIQRRGAAPEGGSGGGRSAGAGPAGGAGPLAGSAGGSGGGRPADTGPLAGSAGASNRGRPPDLRLVRSTLAVARYVRGSRGLSAAFATVALIGFFGMPTQALTVVFAEDVFDRGPGGYGLMLTVIGAGAVAATPAVASMGGRVPRSRMQRVGMLVYGSAVVSLAAAPTFVLFLAPLAFIGAAHLVSASVLNTTVQLHVDEGRRAQVLAQYIMILMAANPLGQLSLGQLIEAVGARPAFGAYGAALLAGTALLQGLGWLRHMDAGAEPGSYSPQVAPEAHPTTPAPPHSPKPVPDTR